MPEPPPARGVLTWRPGISLAEASGGPLAVTAALRVTGYPAPATELAAQVGDGVAVVQELLPGTAARHVDTAILDQAVHLSARHRAAPAAATTWAHMSLRMADWAIRHFDPARVPYCLDLANQRLS